MGYAINNNLTPFISTQNHYNLVYREEESEILPTLKMFGVGAIPWSPLARGILTRPFERRTASARAQGDDAWVHNYIGQGTQDIIKRLEEIAIKKGIRMVQVAIAWMLSKDGVAAPIVGTTNLDNLRDILGEFLSYYNDVRTR